MLINFTIKNWMSFRDETKLSMVAGREKHHKERLPYLEEHKLRLLPVTSIYGGNASGKTNLYKALEFARELIVNGTSPDAPIEVESFKLGSAEHKSSPSFFGFELLIENEIYEFSFTLNRQEILEERLVHIKKASEETLYQRKNGRTADFSKKLGDQNRLALVSEGTRNNQLFLTNAVWQKVDSVKPIYNWFKYNLQLISPNSQFKPFEKLLEEGHSLYSTMSETLSNLDTGISELKGEEVLLDSLRIPLNLIRSRIQEGGTIRIREETRGERYIISQQGGELIAKKFVTYHLNKEGASVKFELKDESDGSQRLIDLLPAFLELFEQNSSNVYVIDELDRSLHTLLVQHLLEKYLDHCAPHTRNQLLFTTHNLLLMDQDLFRRDEIWVTERNLDGSTELISFSEYKEIRKDKDIRKSYLQGRLGGIPYLTG